VEDRVRTGQEERSPLELPRSLVVLHELDVQAGLAQLLRERAALVLRGGERADHALGRCVQQGLPDSGRGRVSQHDGVLEALTQLDRDRRRGPVATLDERFRLLAHELPQLVGLELGVPARRRQEPPHRARDRADAGPAPGQLSAGGDELLEQLFAAGRSLVSDFHQGLDRPPRHPAATMATVGSELLDPLPNDRGHMPILALIGFPRK
jgi:hypothetical protein